MSTFFNIDCGGETVTLEKTDDGDIIFHGWDEETELAAIELGFEPSACLMLWNAINDDMLDDEVFEQIYNGNALCIEALLFVGATANAIDDIGGNPLHRAARHGHTEIAKILLEAGASVDAKDDTDWTPLHEAARWGCSDVVRILLKAGSSVDFTNNLRLTPLETALEHKHASVVKVIEDWIAEHGE